MMLRSTLKIVVLLATAVATGCGFSFGNADIGLGDDGLAAPSRNLNSADGGSEDTPPGPPPADDAPANGASDAGGGGAVDAPPPGPLKTFVTSEIVNGNIGGPDGADALCNKLAKAAGLPGKYNAWISTATVNAIDRIKGNGPWQTVDGKVVAQNKAQLASGTVSDDLDKDEKGQTPPSAEDRVWTGTGPDGKYAGAGKDCGGWTTTTGNGHVGEAAQSDDDWTSLEDEACTEVNRVYCFQQ